MEEIINGDCFEELATIEDNRFDALVTDPPYGLSSTMGQAMIEDCLRHWLSDQRFLPERVAHQLKRTRTEWDAFCPSPALWQQVKRTMKEGAYGLVFAGSSTLDLMTMSLRLAGFEIRDIVMWTYSTGMPRGHSVERLVRGIDPSIASKFSKIGTRLKPAYEPIVLIRKPAQTTLGRNAIKSGKVGLQVGAVRVGDEERINPPCNGRGNGYGLNYKKEAEGRKCVGRYPANLLFDEGSAKSFDGVSNGASRFFYVDKPSTQEKGIDNDHPTVKPLSLMRYLVKMVCPDGGEVVDPFAGSGTTGIACKAENMNFLGIERNRHYSQIAKMRIDRAGREPRSEEAGARRKAKSKDKEAQLSLF